VQSEQRERIRRALDVLPPKARAIIMLSDVEGLSYREIAEVLRCPIGTVMSRLHNARKRLKALLGPMLGLLLWLGTCAGPSLGPADAQPIIRFGVRVLQASNPAAQDVPPPPPRGFPPPPPPPGQPLPAPLTGSPPGQEADHYLRRVMPQLRTLFRYNEYTPLDRHRVDGPLGTPQRFAIPGDRWLEVTPDQMQGHSVRMHVRLLKGEQPEMNASLVASPGAPAVFGGLPHGSGVLIIILWVNPNLSGPGAPPGPGGPPDRPFHPR
jgi:hypothetical protein